MADFLDVSDLTPRIAYTVGASPQTVFVFPFRIFDDDDLKVYVDNVLKTKITDYTVSFTESVQGGSITFAVAQASVTVVLVRDVPIELSIHVPATGQLDIPGLNTMFSKFTAMLQQVRNLFQRALVQPLSDANTIAALPTAANRASKFLGFDANGDPIAALSPATAVVSAFMQTLLDDVDAATARTTLGLAYTTTTVNLFNWSNFR
jgi:hypothetical protein